MLAILSLCSSWFCACSSVWLVCCSSSKRWRSASCAARISVRSCSIHQALVVWSPYSTGQALICIHSRRTSPACIHISWCRGSLRANSGRASACSRAMSSAAMKKGRAGRALPGTGVAAPKMPAICRLARCTSSLTV